MPTPILSTPVTRPTSITLRAALLAGATAAVCLAAPHAHASRFAVAGQSRTPATGPTVTQRAVTGPYRVVMSIGPLENMYTMAEYRKKRPRHGELILSGAGMMGRMHNASMGMFAPHHLEAHIYNARDGKVVTTARVGITVTDLHTRRVIVVLVLTMEGIGEGVKDFHYGNTIMLMTEHYRVGVTVNGARASFVVNWREPSSSM